MLRIQFQYGDTCGPGRVAKCHIYDGCVKKLASWGKKLGKTKKLAKKHFWKICATSVRSIGQTIMN